MPTDQDSFFRFGQSSDDTDVMEVRVAPRQQVRYLEEFKKQDSALALILMREVRRGKTFEAAISTVAGQLESAVHGYNRFVEKEKKAAIEAARLEAVKECEEI